MPKNTSIPACAIDIPHAYSETAAPTKTAAANREQQAIAVLTSRRNDNNSMSEPMTRNRTELRGREIF
ncbi:hypothetical protein CS8_022670 [Cupriavidus sp. 8B]